MCLRVEQFVSVSSKENLHIDRNIYHSKFKSITYVPFRMYIVDGVDVQNSRKSVACSLCCCISCRQQFVDRLYRK